MRQKNKLPRKKRPNGYWDSEVNIERELRLWIRYHRRFPSSGELRKSGLSALGDALRERGGIRSWRTRLGYTASQKPTGYWNDGANIERELKAWVTEHGRFPIRSDLARAGRLDLSMAVSNHGGFHKWCKRLGLVPSQKPTGYWNDVTNIERELKAWINEYGEFPTKQAIKKTGKYALQNGINKSGGIRFWRNKLGYSALRKPVGYWDNPANIERELRAWIQEHGQFPTQKELVRSERSDLAVGISKKGGLDQWRARLGYGPITPECLREHADVLARVVMALDVADTAAFWVALQKRWTMADLAAAIREFVEGGKLERFRKLLTAAG